MVAWRISPRGVPTLFQRTVPWFRVQLLEDRDRWALWIPVLLGTGIGLYFSLEYEPGSWVGFLAAAGTAASWWLFRHEPRDSLAVVGLMVVALGFWASQLRASLVAAPILTKSSKLAEVNGRVLSVESHKRGSRIVLGNLNIEGLDAYATPTKVRITVSGKSEIQPGDVVSVRAGLRPPPRPASPNAFDFARGAYFEGYAGGGLRHWHSEAVASNSRPYGPTD